MNNLDEMPPMCQNCPYWEWAERPYFCDCKERYENNILPNNSHNRSNRMILQVEIKDLRRMIKEKCKEIISDEKLADELYCKICEIENDTRFTVVDDKQSK